MTAVKRLRLCTLLLALLPVLAAPRPVLAVEPSEMLKDAALETRARALSKELRCMVCQNQSIDDSEAPLAHDLRVLVRERLQAGDSDAQVVDFLVARYGEFVLLNPRLSWRTAVLWGLPPAVLLLGMLALIVVVRRRSTTPAAEMANLTRRRGSAAFRSPAPRKLIAPPEAASVQITIRRCSAPDSFSCNSLPPEPAANRETLP